MAESGGQNANVVIEQLRGWNANLVSEVIEFHGETTIVVPKELLRAAAEYCRAKLQFNYLSDATSVDRFPVEPRFELNYSLVSIPKKTKIRLRTRVSGADATVDSVIPVWPGAGWMEREIFDLMGIRFNGHPVCGAFYYPMIGKAIRCGRISRPKVSEIYHQTFLPGFKKS